MLFNGDRECLVITTKLFVFEQRLLNSGGVDKAIDKLDDNDLHFDSEIAPGRVISVNLLKYILIILLNILPFLIASANFHLVHNLHHKPVLEGNAIILIDLKVFIKLLHEQIINLNGV